MKHFLTEAEKAALEARIARAESRTRGEIVTVIARASDGYRYIPTLWAALAALSVPAIHYLVEGLTLRGWTDPGDPSDALALVWPLQALVFLGLGALFQLPRVRVALVPRSVRNRGARRATPREQFFLQGLHRTELRTGTLVFVSLAEHYVEILADTGHRGARGAGRVGRDGGRVRAPGCARGRVADGFAVAIDACGAVLAEHHPDERGRADSRTSCRTGSSRCSDPPRHARAPPRRPAPPVRGCGRSTSRGAERPSAVGPSGKAQAASPSLGTKRSATPLLHQRSPVGAGPSSNT